MKSNGDKIREMGNEQMAVFLTSMFWSLGKNVSVNLMKKFLDESSESLCVSASKFVMEGNKDGNC